MSFKFPVKFLNSSKKKNFQKILQNEHCKKGNFTETVDKLTYPGYDMHDPNPVIN